MFRGVMAIAQGSVIVFILICTCLSGCSQRAEYGPELVDVRVIQSANAVDVNTASVNELETLPHIGRKTAEAIVKFRIENGPFRRPEHLMQIRGINEGRFLAIRPHVRTE